MDSGCTVCGAVMADVDVHARWHIAVDPDVADAQIGSVLMAFIDELDPAQVEQGILDRLGGLDGGEHATGAAAIAYLRDEVAA